MPNNTVDIPRFEWLREKLAEENTLIKFVGGPPNAGKSTAIRKVLSPFATISSLAQLESKIENNAQPITVFLPKEFDADNFVKWKNDF
jgi:AAA+ ATPase superfamily predicted ATPase